MRLNAYAEVDLSTVSFSDLQWRYGTGIDTSTGKGSYKVHSYRYGVMTKLGDIEVSVWYQLMEQLVERENEQWLLDALIQWEREHDCRKKSASALRKEALQSHASRLFDCPAWVGFVSFNKQHRPHVYAQANIVTVITECCGIPGEVTQEQIERAYADTVHCPYCGRWSNYVLSDEATN